MTTVDPRILNLAGFISPLAVTSPSGNSIIVAWYSASSGPMRATVYADAPGYVFPQQASSITNARDFLYTFITQTTSFSKNGSARAAWDTFNGQINAYQSAVVDYVNSGAGASWRPPFPQTIATMWRNLLGAYTIAWAAARSLASQVLAAQSGGQVSYSGLPNTNTISAKTVTPIASTGAPQGITAMPPEVQAQVLGTQRVGVNPQAGMSTGSSTLPSNAAGSAAQQAQQTMTNAPGDPVQVPDAPGTPTTPSGIPIVHTPIYKETSFWVAVGAGVLLLGGVYFFWPRKRSPGTALVLRRS